MQGYTDEPVKKIIQGVEEAQLVRLDRWKLSVEKNENVKNYDEEEVGACIFNFLSNIWLVNVTAVCFQDIFCQRSYEFRIQVPN